MKAYENPSLESEKISGGQAVYIDQQSPFYPEDNSADIGESDTILDKILLLVRQY